MIPFASTETQISSAPLSTRKAGAGAKSTPQDGADFALAFKATETPEAKSGPGQSIMTDGQADAQSGQNGASLDTGAGQHNKTQSHGDGTEDGAKLHAATQDSKTPDTVTAAQDWRSQPTFVFTADQAPMAANVAAATADTAATVAAGPAADTDDSAKAEDAMAETTARPAQDRKSAELGTPVPAQTQIAAANVIAAPQATPTATPTGRGAESGHVIKTDAVAATGDAAPRNVPPPSAQLTTAAQRPLVSPTGSRAPEKADKNVQDIAIPTAGSAASRVGASSTEGAKGSTDTRIATETKPTGPSAGPVPSTTSAAPRDVASSASPAAPGLTAGSSTESKKPEPSQPDSPTRRPEPPKTSATVSPPTSAATQTTRTDSGMRPTPPRAPDQPTHSGASTPQDGVKVSVLQPASTPVAPKTDPEAAKVTVPAQPTPQPVQPNSRAPRTTFRDLPVTEDTQTSRDWTASTTTSQGTVTDKPKAPPTTPDPAKTAAFTGSTADPDIAGRGDSSRTTPDTDVPASHDDSGPAPLRTSRSPNAPTQSSPAAVPPATARVDADTSLTSEADSTETSTAPELPPRTTSADAGQSLVTGRTMPQAVTTAAVQTDPEWKKTLESNGLDTGDTDPVDPLGTVSSAHGSSSVQTSHGITQGSSTTLAHSVSRQIAAAMPDMPDKPIEIALSPEELGRVRLVMHARDGGMVVAVHAERPETLDLMRRNIDMLAQDMRDLGYEQTSFSFNDHPRGQSARPDQDFTITSPVAETDPTLASIASAAPRRVDAGQSGLDLRI